ncbi:MAG: Na(+)-translocating NADH-quinone reductase subunit A [Bacteroidales bacterium]|jgi:Na+-transporting NADH:ubiquinone oxidoreductase subunit A
MSKVIKIKRGLDIRLKGAAEKSVTQPGLSGLYAVKPTDFKGFEPRILVKAGQEVLTGTPLFCDKTFPEMVFVSPVSGTVTEVVRGERRKLLDLLVQTGSQPGFVPLAKGDPGTMDEEAIRQQILKSGLWPSIIQRPYGVIARPSDKPRDIFISTFDSAPLAPDYEFILKDEAKAFATGIKALRKLTTGKVHIGLDASKEPSKIFANLEGVQYTVFSGPHPAGNAGIQIHHVAPVNKGETVWTLTPQFVALIGRTFLLGQLDPSWTFALAGSYINGPQYVKGIMGMAVAPVLAGRMNTSDLPPRVISGNVLTGTNIGPSGYLGYYDSVVTVIPEGKHFDLLGWAMPGLNKFSMSKTFLSSLFPKKAWDIDTNLQGGHRAFVMTGQYNKVFPMDIFPVHLLKAALIQDIDLMEQLGIYEVIEEDMALCEFVCTSKTEVQEILRSGLDLVRKEMS